MEKFKLESSKVFLQGVKTISEEIEDLKNEETWNLAFKACVINEIVEKLSNATLKVSCGKKSEI